MTNEEYVRTLHGLNAMISDILSNGVSEEDTDILEDTLRLAGKFLTSYEGELRCRIRK